MNRVKLLIPLLLLLSTGLCQADNSRRDLAKDKTLYTVGYAHLDTQWRWDYTKTIDEYLKNTLDDNFELFEKYPNYKFNFTGAVRYMMMKEYYPQRYEKLKKYIAAGRWFVAGSSVDEGDVSIASPESVIRHVLYGNQHFRKEFGKESYDYMLPDCFGFQRHMPSVWAHCGLLGFSTQKLTWHCAVGIPFNIGVWEGPDGKSVIAALNPGGYTRGLSHRVDTNDYWVNRVNENGYKYGVYADYHYFGTGDTGGAPAKWAPHYDRSVGNIDSKINVLITSSDRMYKDITPQQKEMLPVYRGDLLLTEHSAGTLTSIAYMKRWNCQNEILADCAERAAVAAMWMGAAEYPLERLRTCWIRVLANQMHDILPGTSIPKAYEYSFNDEIIALNGFSSIIKHSVGAVSKALDTRVQGKALVVYNPLAFAREDAVEAELVYDKEVPKEVKVFSPDGREVPCQIISRSDNSLKIVFIAPTESLSFSVFDVRQSDEPCLLDTQLKAGANTIENAYYRVTINTDGDVASIYDKQTERELLSEPMRYDFQHESPSRWPAWNMDWQDRKEPPFAKIRGPAELKIVENGPARVTVQIKRQAQNSYFTSRISLTAGKAGTRVEFNDNIDWQSKACSLKAAFPLTVSNPVATYNYGLGTTIRNNNHPRRFESPLREWFDLTDKNAGYGVAVLSHAKFGSDKPTDNLVRLTLLFTPSNIENDSFPDQTTQDWGRHDIKYALYAHKGNWPDGRCDRQARCLNVPLIAFEARPNDGKLGRIFSMVKVNTPQVDIKALKKAEETDDYVIVRLQELEGSEVKDVKLTFAGGIDQAYEVDGQERRIAVAKVDDGKLKFDMGKYAIRSFAVKPANCKLKSAKPISIPITLAYNADVASSDKNRADGAFTASGKTYPAELLPAELVIDDIKFELGRFKDGSNNAVACTGQSIKLPRPEYDAVYILAAAEEDTDADFIIAANNQTIQVNAWSGFIGQYDNRIWENDKVVGIEKGYIKRDEVAWFASHRHDPKKGNESYQFSYLFKYRLDIPAASDSLTLPDNPKVKILAMSACSNSNDCLKNVMPLYDDFDDREPIELRSQP
jgi:alpha-mannosidase